METTKSLVLGAQPAELYLYCMNFESMPTYLQSVRSVERTGDHRSRWKVDGPHGEILEWTTELTRLEPGKRIAWSSQDDGNIKTSGQVTFNPLTHGQTEVTVTLKVVSKNGKEEDAGALESLIDRNLRSFKTFVENP